MSSAVPQSPNVSVVLAELLAAQKEETRRWLRTEMDRLVGPMLDSFFNRLETKLTNGQGRRRSSGGGPDGAQVVNPNINQSANLSLQPSTSSHLNSQYVNYSHHQPNGPINTLDSISNQQLSQTQPVTIKEEPNTVQHNNHVDEECDCEECVDKWIEVKKEDDDDDESPSRPVKRPRMDTTQPSSLPQSHLQPNHLSMSASNPFTQRPSDQQASMHFDDNLDDDVDQETLDQVKKEIKEEEEMKRRENEHEGGDERHDEGDRLASELSEAIDTRATIEEPGHDNSMAEQSIVIQPTDGDSSNEIEEEIDTEPTTDPIQPNLAQPNRQWQCSYCHKPFDRKSALQRHVRVHTGERPFQCDLCAKRFKLRKSLATHQLIHQNLKNFRCPECNRRFNRKDNLDSHLRTHSGERPFACRHCDKSFPKSDTRNKHEQAKHQQVKPYRCKECGHTATTQSAVIKHIRVVHLELPRTIKEQQALNIVNDRDPAELVEKV